MEKITLPNFKIYWVKDTFKDTTGIFIRVLFRQIKGVSPEEIKNILKSAGVEYEGNYYNFVIKIESFPKFENALKLITERCREEKEQHLADLVGVGNILKSSISTQTEMLKLIEIVNILQGETCQRCGQPAMTTHHIIPKRAGGKNKLDNLICLCGSCHSKLHGFLNTELQRLVLKEHPDFFQKNLKEFLTIKEIEELISG